MTELGAFNHELLSRFAGCYVSPNEREVWIRYADAFAAVDLARAMGLRLLGMEAFVVADGAVYPAMSRIADFSGAGFSGDPFEVACALLAEGWSLPPDDVHPDASGEYMIDLVVDDAGAVPIADASRSVRASGVEVTPRLARWVRATFANGTAGSVLNALRGLEADAIGQQDRERIQAALVIRSGGDWKHFEGMLHLVRMDWRDALMAADLGNDDWPHRLAAVLGE